MKWWGFRLLVIFCASLCHSFAIESPSKPLLIVGEISSWFGSSGPRFVLYENGTVIFQAPRELTFRRHRNWDWLDHSFYRIAHTADARILLSQLVSGEAKSWDTNYRVSNSTDQSSTFVWLEGRCLEIYGDWREARTSDEDSPLDVQIAKDENLLRNQLPTSLTKLLKAIDAFSIKGATPWLPAMVPVRLDDYSQAPNKSAVWPSDLPQPTVISSPRSYETFAKVEIPGSMLHRLVELGSLANERRPIVIGDHKFALSDVRFPWPGSEIFDHDIGQLREEKERALLEKLSPEERKRLLGE